MRNIDRETVNGQQSSGCKTMDFVMLDGRKGVTNVEHQPVPLGVTCEYLSHMVDTIILDITIPGRLDARYTRPWSCGRQDTQ